MRQTGILIVGQGISGTMLSWYLEKAGMPFIIIDDQDPFSASRVAAGVINPVTGRRIVTTWMIETLLPFAREAYSELSTMLGIPAIEQKNIIDFFPSAQMLISFRERVAEQSPYLSMPEGLMEYDEHFHAELGYGEISPCYMVQLQTLLPAWRGRLKQQDRLIEEKFSPSELIILESSVQYQGVEAEKIIFCDGASSAESPWFKNLPFALNKGEALIIRSETLPAEKIYKKGFTLVPLKKQLFWAGSSYEWDFIDAGPSPIFLEKAVGQLAQWLKAPFTVEAHLASVRPATIERRPFVGLHPQQPKIGILNGMGTKGCSLAPYFAEQLASHLTKNTPILPEANINRFARILTST